MSRARPVFPGAVVFSTRRVHKRQLLLRPSPRVNQAVEYIIAVLAARHGILLHALCVLANHMHNVSSDPLGRCVEFERDCHSLIARVLNAMHGEFEGLWSREQTCRVTCLEPADTLAKMAYTMANPVQALLVMYGKSWPGARAAWPMKPRTIRRPPGFFRDEEAGGTWPEEVTLELHRPPGYDHLSDDELAVLIQGAIGEREQAARDRARRAGKTFLGRRRVLHQARHTYPNSREDRFQRCPAVAARSKWVRIERLQRDHAWLEAYEAAKARARAGHRTVRYPFGTWKQRVYYGAACDPPDHHLAA